MISFFQQKRILVTGASGYLATNLINAVKDIDCTIIRLSRAGQLLPLEAKAETKDIAGDICLRQTWVEALEGVDIVYHFAAQTSVYIAEDDALADLNANVVPMLTLLEVCREKEYKPAILFSGTVTQAGVPQDLPVNESCVDNPITIYDTHKLIAENYLKYYCQNKFVSGAVLRLANVYGPGPKSSSSDRGVINMMMRKAIAGEELTVYGKGDCLRDYVYIDDVVSAFLKAAECIEKTNGNHYIIGSGEGNTVADAIDLIADTVTSRTGRAVSVKHIEPPKPQSPIEDRNFVADITKFSQSTGWQPGHSLAEGIDKTLKSILKTYQNS
ncbi:MAG: NAD-dependent epimerase/dehydratase family protein [Planctomycetes bacterium]|nr:NAD-dependent epimerase/dehydratase family protein [Planctomycetota bacterium]